MTDHALADSQGALILSMRALTDAYQAHQMHVTNLIETLGTTAVANQEAIMDRVVHVVEEMRVFVMRDMGQLADRVELIERELSADRQAHDAMAAKIDAMQIVLDAILSEVRQS